MAWQTAYEIILEKGENRWLVAYANMTPSRARLVRVVRNRWNMIENVTGPIKQWNIGKEKAPGILTANDYTIRYSGRTERDAKGQEYPFIGDVLGG